MADATDPLQAFATVVNGRIHTTNPGTHNKVSIAKSESTIENTAPTFHMKRTSWPKTVRL